MSEQLISEMLEAGAHFGHQTRHWNPKMRRYIFGKRNGIYIIDLQKTRRRFQEAADFVYRLGTEGRKILFVGTKRQAQEAMAEEARRCGQHFVTHRWLGGTLTNFVTIRKSIERMKEIESRLGDPESIPTKKERLRLERDRSRINRNLKGIRDLTELPDALFVVDPKKEAIAVAEANKLRIPVIGIVDTNCNPELVDYVIPGNDDAIRTIRLFASRIVDAYLAGAGKLKQERMIRMKDAYQAGYLPHRSEGEAAAAPEPAAPESAAPEPALDLEGLGYRPAHRSEEEAATAPKPGSAEVSDSLGPPAGGSERDGGDHLHWNTRFPEDATVNDTGMLFSDHPYVMETAIEPFRDKRSLADSAIDKDGLFQGEEEVPVRFTVEAEGARLAPIGGVEFVPSLSSPSFMCSLAEGTGTPFQWLVQASEEGSIKLTIFLKARGGFALAQWVELEAIARRPPRHPRPQRRPQEHTRPIDGPSLASLPSAVSLRFRPNNGDIELDLETAQRVVDKVVAHTSHLVLANLAVKWRKRLVAQSETYGPRSSSPNDPRAGFLLAEPRKILLEFAKVGAEMHEAVFGHPNSAGTRDDLKNLARAIAGHGWYAEDKKPRLQIFAEKLPLPWGVMYDAAYVSAAQANPPVGYPNTRRTSTRGASGVDVSRLTGSLKRSPSAISPSRCSSAPGTMAQRSKFASIRTSTKSRR